MTSATEAQQPAPAVAHGDIERRYARAALYSGALGGLSQALYGLTPVLIARSLKPGDYGVYSVVMSLSAIVTGVFGLGQNSALHKLVPQYYAQNRGLGGAILANALMLTSALLAVFCAIFFFGADWFAARLYRDASLTGVFRFSALLMFTLTLFNLALSAVAGLQDFRTFNQMQMLRNVALLVLALFGVRLAGVRGALLGQFLASAFGLLLLGASGARLLRLRFPDGLRPALSCLALRLIASFFLPTLLITLLNLPTYWWASTMVMRHAGFTQAGLLGVAYALSQLIFLIPTNLYTPVMTYLSEAHAASLGAVFADLVSANLRLIWAFSLPLALGLALFSPLLILGLFGPAYLAAAPLAFWLCLNALLMLLVGMLNTAVMAAGRMWPGLSITFGWTLLFVSAGLMCIPRWGAAGAAAVFALSHVFYLTGLYVYCRRTLQIRQKQLSHLIGLTLLSFGAAALLVFKCGNAAQYVAGAPLLLCLIVVEWRWIFAEDERGRLRSLDFARLIRTIRA